MSNIQTVTLHLYDNALTRSNQRTKRVKFCDVSDLREAVKLAISRRMGPETTRIAVIVDGKPVSINADWEVEDGGVVHAAPMPGGLAVAGTIALNIAIAAAATAASYALTKSQLKKLSSTDDTDSRRYGFNRLSFDARVGDPIPVVFGRRRFGPKIVSVVPDDSVEGDSKLRMLLLIGWGPNHAIGNQVADFEDVASSALEGIYLNDQPISNFTGVRAWGRMGSDSQNAIPGFDNPSALKDVGVGGVTLAPNTPFQVTTSGPVQAVVPRIRFPAGLYALNGTQIDARSVQYRVRWRVTAGPGAWSDWITYTVERAEQSEFTSAGRLDFLADPAAQLDVEVERLTAVVGATEGADEMVWDSIIEETYDSQRYAGLGLLALELTAGEEIAGVPRVSTDMNGLRVRVWDGVSDPTSPTFIIAATDNPAWHALELLTNTTWGLGATYGDSRIDMPSLFAWAQYCDEVVERPGGGTRQRFRHHYAMDRQQDGWDWLRQICRAGRCSPATVGGVVRFIVDKPQALAVETFGDGSIAVDDNGVAQWAYTREDATGGRNRPNRTVVQFENEQADGLPDAVAKPGYGELWLAYEPVRENQVRLDGVTDPDQAAAEAAYIMDKTRFLTRNVTFITVRPMVMLQPGERFDKAFNLTGWGTASGRLAADADGNRITLDRTVQLQSGTQYVVQVHHQDNSIEIRDVVSPAGVYARGESIELTSAFTTDAMADEEYQLGESGIHVKPFTCTAVRPVEFKEALAWEISGVEYDEDVYNEEVGDVTLPPYSTLDDKLRTPGPVLDLKAFERVINGISAIELAWRQKPEDQLITSSFRIFRRRVGTTAWVQVPDPKVSRRGSIIEIDDRDVAYDFAVVAVSYQGKFLRPDDPRVPKTGIAFGLGEAPPPPPDTVTATQDAGSTYDLTWDAVEGAIGYQVIYGGPQAGTTLPNEGAEDCYVLARTTDPELTGLVVPPSIDHRWWVRSVGPSGRLSWTATDETLNHANLPAGTSVRGTYTPDLSSDGTLTNLTWNGTTSRLELTDPDLDGVWESPEVVLGGGAALTTFMHRILTGNDTDDPTIAAYPELVPSIEADQWGVVDDDPDRIVGMLMPPYPDARIGYKVEIRTAVSTTFGAWTEWAPFTSFDASVGKYQVRVTIERQSAPYRPSLAAFHATIVS
ncbi:MAG: phage tail protein [Phycisphaera sp.]|nr:MAG: phage tail protein [Phycisphaera sp.]